MGGLSRPRVAGMYRLSCLLGLLADANNRSFHRCAG